MHFRRIHSIINKQMVSRLTAVINTRTFRQSAVTTLSTFTSAGLGAVFYLLLARLLGATDYGLFSLAQTALILTVTVADAGMTQGLVRFAGLTQFASLALRIKLIVGLLCWLVFTMAAAPLAQHVFRQPHLAPLLPVIGFGIGCYLLATFSLSLAQARQKFWLWGGLQVGPNLLRLVLLAIVFFVWRLDALSALYIFSFASLFTFFISWPWLDTQIFFTSPSVSDTRQFWHFNKWTALFSILSSFAARIDIFLTGRYATLTDVGAYSLSVTMVTFLPQLAAAIGTVTAPKFARFTDVASARRYLFKSTLFLFSISLVVALLMIPVALAVIHFAGPAYTPSFIPFLILLLSLIIFMAGNPLRDFLLYFLHRPRFFVWANLAQGLTLLILGRFFVPAWGIIGTALAVLVGHILLATICLGYYLHENNRSHPG